MTKEQRELLEYKIQEEGIEHTFIDYSRWEEVQDREFHEVREDFIEAYGDLINMLKRRGIRCEG